MSQTALKTLEIPIETATYATFRPFGTLLERSPDGKLFGPDEAQLVLDRGTPRFYILDIAQREFAFSYITRHMQVTQCLGSAGGAPWVIAVAPPNDPDDPKALCDPSTIRAFHIPGDKAIQLARSAWHAGPYFDGASQSFFNLELADTNQVDHHPCRLDEHFGVKVVLKR